MTRKSSISKNGQGSTRQIDKNKWECIVQSKYLNPDTNKPKRIKRVGKTENEARKMCLTALAAWEKEFESTRLNQKIDKKKTFGEYMREFIEEEVKPDITDSSYKSYIYTMDANFYNHGISKLRLDELSKIKLETYFDNMIKEKSIRTAETPMQLCKRCTKWLAGRSLIPEDYGLYAKFRREKKDEFFRKDITETPQKKVFTNEDIMKFYDAYKNNLSQYCPAIIFLLETMMRGQELLALTIDDIDFEKNIIHIRSAVSERFIENDKDNGLEYYIKVPKNGKERDIYMTPLARETALYMIEQTRLKSRDNPLNLLFPSYNRQGKMRSMDSFEVMFKDLCNKIGVDRDVRVTKSGRKEGLNIHALRHTAITIANTAPGSNVINTALMAGHTAIRTENIYTHSNFDALKTIKTAGEVVLNHKTEDPIDQKEQELYEMYLRLKEKFDK